MRLRTVGPEDATTLCGHAVTTSRLSDCLIAVRDGLDWDVLKATHTRDRGLAVAAGMDVDVLSMDSERTPFELGAWSSRGTHMTGSSVGKAAREIADTLSGRDGSAGR
ncbi:MAG: hypothetical protein ABWX74_10740 [Aeromicrobium sp.]